MTESNNILSVLEEYLNDNPDEIGKEIASDFRRRRIEKGLTQRDIAERANVALSNVVRFEQKGLISLVNLIALAVAMGYAAEIRHIFSEAKFSTMAEMEQIKRNANKKKAYSKQ